MNLKLTVWPRLAAVGIVGLLVIGVGAQLTPPKVFRVGVLNPDEPIEAVFDGFKEEMARLGYAEGQTIEYLYDGPVGNAPGSLEAAAAKLMDAPVDLILAITSPGAEAAKQAVEGTDMPVIFWVLSDPVQEHYVATMQRPGGNMTGMTIGIEGVASEGRRLEWLTQLSPAIKRVFIPYDPNNPPVVEQALPTIQAAADSLGVELALQPVHTPEEAQASFETLPANTDAIYIIHLDRMVMTTHLEIVERSIQERMPLSVFDDRMVSEGALMAFGTRYFAIGEQAARMADQVLKGAAPAELPVEIPEFYLTINLRTAEAIGLEVPETIIRQADIVIR